MYGPVGAHGVGGAIVIFDALLARRIWYVPPEAGFERIPTAVGEEGGHAGSAQSSGWWVIKGVVAIFVFGVAVDGLSLSFAPADTPSAVSTGGRNGDNAAHVLWAEIGVFKYQHTPHGSSYGGCNLPDAKVVKNDFVYTAGMLDAEDGGSGGSVLHIVAYCGQREFRTVATHMRVPVDAGDRTGTAIWTAQTIQADDEKS